MIELDTTTFLMDLYKYVKDLNDFRPFDYLRLFELKNKAVTVKINVIYFGVDTIFCSFHETPI